MLGTNAYLTQQAFNQTNTETRNSVRLTKLFWLVKQKARLGRIWAKILGKNRNLGSLSAQSLATSSGDRYYVGIRTIAIDRIRGSEGRIRDFDCDFYPLRAQDKSRWISVAQARMDGTPLPPVDLIRIGEVYFVRDGHHRISVARAMGEKFIEAEVTIWE